MCSLHLLELFDAILLVVSQTFLSGIASSGPSRPPLKRGHPLKIGNRYLLQDVEHEQDGRATCQMVEPQESL